MTGKYVVVTTKYRGVFFGKLDVDEAPAKVELSEARNTPRWRNTKGFVGLAKNGPNSDCRVGPAAPKQILWDITSITECTPEAVAAWEAEPWAS